VQLGGLAPITLNKTVGTDPSSCASNNQIGVDPDTTVTYCYEVTNNSAISLTLHDLADSELGNIFSSSPYTLTPGASFFVTVSTVITMETVNIGTWVAYNSGPTDVVTATSTATVTILTAPIISVVPGSLSSVQPINTEVTQTLTISNTGDANLVWDIFEDISGKAVSFAAGNSQNLRVSLSIDSDANVTSFFVDDVGILESVACDAPDDILWLAVSPLAGTTGVGSNSLVAINFDSTGYASGVYRGTLCVNSNDNTNPLISVPLTMTVLPNNAPVAVGDAYSTDADTTLMVKAPGVLSNDMDGDGNGLTAVLDTDVMSGTLALNADGSFDYTPDAGFVGEDGFTYHANDGLDDSNVATVTITVLEFPVTVYTIYLPFVVKE
jgi:hypothetical protein